MDTPTITSTTPILEAIKKYTENSHNLKLRGDYVELHPLAPQFRFFSYHEQVLKMWMNQGGIDKVLESICHEPVE